MNEVLKKVFDYFNDDSVTVPEDLYKEVFRELKKEGADNDLRFEISALLNRFSKDDYSETPDFILANYLLRCLDDFHLTLAERKSFFVNKSNTI